MNILYFFKRQNKTFFILFFGFCFLLLDVFLVQNEVYGDDWFINASAGRLFGDSNYSLAVLGPNFIFSSIVYILSFFIARLFWVHVLLVIFNFISFLILEWVIFKRFGNLWGSLYSVLLMLFLSPLVGYELQFTTTAALQIASGFVLLITSDFYDKTRGNNNNNKDVRYFSAGWIVLGTCVRFDCLYYSFALMSIVFLVLFIKESNYTLNKHTLMSLVKKSFVYVVVILTAFALNFINKVYVDYKEPGFLKWNATRTLVDDYPIPDYQLHKYDYSKIGMSYNDYCLLKSWNNQDFNFFTTERYAQILDIKKTQNNSVSHSVKKIAKEIFQHFRLNKQMLIFIVLFGLSFIIFAPYISLGFLVLLIVSISMLVYFSLIDRLIWRTEWPIWITLLCAFITIFVCSKVRVSEISRKLISFYLVIIIICSIPLINKCKVRIKNPNTYGRYVLSKILHREPLGYATLDPSIVDYTIKNKELIYCAFWSEFWLQPFPIYAKDTFRLYDVGNFSNLGTLGQYWAYHSTIRNNFARYGIYEVFKSIPDGPIRTIGRKYDYENTRRVNELICYLKEHYNANVCYSVEDIVGDGIVGQYLSELPSERYQTFVDNSIYVYYDSKSEIGDMARFVVPHFKDTRYFDKQKKFYLILSSTDNQRKVYTFKKNDNQVILFASDLDSGKEYRISIMFREQEKWILLKTGYIFRMKDNL